MTVSRKAIVTAGAALLVAALVVAYVVWWNRLADGVSAGIAKWAASRTAAGWQVATGDIAVSGFPFTVHLTLPAPTAKDTEGNAWQGPPIDVAVPPWAPDSPSLSAPGRHVVTLAGAPPIEMTARSATGSLLLDRDGAKDLSIMLAGVTLPGASAEAIDVTAHRLASGPVAHDTASLTATIAVQQIAFEDVGDLPFDRTLTEAKIDARLKGSLPAGPLARALSAWRDDGGTIEIDSIDLAWPPLTVTGDATLALDGAGQPMMAGTFTMRGLPTIVDRLAQAGRIKPSVAGIAKLTLGVLAKPGADGVPETKTPVTIEHRVLYVGPMPLAMLPEVNWGAAAVKPQ